VFSEGRIELGFSGIMIRPKKVREPALREARGRRRL
jgi:hypothetical protein